MKLAILSTNDKQALTFKLNCPSPQVQECLTFAAQLKIKMIYNFLSRFLGIILVVVGYVVLLPLISPNGVIQSHLAPLFQFLLFVLVLGLILDLSLLFYRKRNLLKRSENDIVISGTKNVFRLITFAAFVLFALRAWGIDYKTLFTSLSIVAAAMAILFKDFLSPIIAGLILAWSKQLNINDYVKIGEHKGKILDVSLSKISLLNDDDDLILIGNDKAYASEIINYTKSDVPRVSIPFELHINSIESIELLEKNLIDEIAEFHDIIEKKSFNLKVQSIEKEAISMKFQFTLKNISRDLEKQIRKKTVRKVLNLITSKNQN